MYYSTFTYPYMPFGFGNSCHSCCCRNPFEKFAQFGLISNILGNTFRNIAAAFNPPAPTYNINIYNNYFIQQPVPGAATNSIFTPVSNPVSTTNPINYFDIFNSNYENALSNSTPSLNSSATNTTNYLDIFNSNYDNALSSSTTSLSSSRTSTQSSAHSSTASTNPTATHSSTAASNHPCASGYNGMSNEQLQSIYGNYSKDATVLYRGTAEDLNKYLRGKGVLEGQGQAFIDAQNKYGISASVLAAICINESGHGKSNLAKSKNNVGGVRIAGSKEFRTFSSVAECIDYMGSFLKRGYLDKGLTKLYQINARYCPASDPTDKTGGNSHWASVVNQFSNDIESQLA